MALNNNWTLDLKNPAYGRHRISRPMLIEAPIQKEAYKATVQCNAVQCSAEQCSALWPCMLLFVLVLLSASVERFGVSRMRDFFLNYFLILINRHIADMNPFDFNTLKKIACFFQLAWLRLLLKGEGG